jgi:hypothetical protein
MAEIHTIHGVPAGSTDGSGGGGYRSDGGGGGDSSPPRRRPSRFVAVAEMGMYAQHEARRRRSFLHLPTQLIFALFFFFFSLFAEATTPQARKTYILDLYLGVFAFIDLVFLFFSAVFITAWALLFIPLVAAGFWGARTLNASLLLFYLAYHVISIILAVLYLSLDSHSAGNVIFASIGIVVSLFIIVLTIITRNAIETCDQRQREQVQRLLDNTPCCCGRTQPGGRPVVHIVEGDAADDVIVTMGGVGGGAVVGAHGGGHRLGGGVDVGSGDSVVALDEATQTKKASVV